MIPVPTDADIQLQNAFSDIENRLNNLEKTPRDQEPPVVVVDPVPDERVLDGDTVMDGSLEIGEDLEVLGRIITKPHPTIVSVVDDFIHSGPMANGDIGSLNWNFYTPDTSTITVYVGQANHPGAVYITTAATTGNYGTLYANSAAYGFLNGVTEYRQVWIMRQHTTAVGDAKSRFGLLENVTYAANTNAICFELDSAGFGTNNWHATTKATSATNTDTGIAYAAATYMKFEIHYTAASVKFYIDDVLEATHTTNIPTTGAMMPVWSLWDMNNVARNMVLDYYSMTWKVAR